MAQVRAGIEHLAVRQAGLLTATVPAIASSSKRRLTDLLNVLDRRFLGAARPLRFDTAAWLESNTRQLAQSRLRIYPQSFARYGGAAVREIEQELGKLALIGMPWTRARPRVWAAVREVVGDRQWMVDRILRTETSAIYNGTALAAMEAEDTPEEPMLKRLIATFDKVTGADSVHVHGQVRRVREPFSDGRRSYQAPPNRPHDREIVVPHRAAWGTSLPRLSRPPPEPAETSAPVLPASRPQPSSAVGGRLAAAAAAVTLLAGRVQEQRRNQRALPTEVRQDAAALARQLEQAQLQLALARLAADVELGEGVAAEKLRAGEVVAAGGMAVRVVSARIEGAVVSLVLSVGGQQLRGEVPAAAVLPLQQTTPTMRVSQRDAHLVAETLASAIRAVVVSRGAQRYLAAR
jgi:hypothetical protein